MGTYKKTFAGIENARVWFCNSIKSDCENCGLQTWNNGTNLICADFCQQNQEEARKIMNVNIGFNERQFVEDFAVKYGVYEAIGIHELVKWVELAKKLKGEISIAYTESKFFIELPINLMSKIFGFLPEDKIQDVIKSCVDKNLLVVKDFGNKKWKWYAVGESADEYYNCNAPIDMYFTSNDRYGGNHKFVEEREGYACAICLSSKNTVVHHIDGYLPEREENNKRNKLILLCKSCHAKVHHNSLRIPNSVLKRIGYYDD